MPVKRTQKNFLHFGEFEDESGNPIFGVCADGFKYNLDISPFRTCNRALMSTLLGPIDKLYNGSEMEARWLQYYCSGRVARKFAQKIKVLPRTRNEPKKCGFFYSQEDFENNHYLTLCKSGIQTDDPFRSLLDSRCAKGLRDLAAKTVNARYEQFLRSHCDQQLLSISRQFATDLRLCAYRFGSGHSYRAQALVSHPALSIKIARMYFGRSKESQEIAEDLLILLDGGASTIDIGKRLGMNQWTRKLPDIVSGYDFLGEELARDLVTAFLPKNSSICLEWVQAIWNVREPYVRWADQPNEWPRLGRIRWIARNYFKLGNTARERRRKLRKLVFWFSTCLYQISLRPESFDERMSFDRIAQLAVEAASEGQGCEDDDFERPWLPGCKLREYDIVPLTNPYELYDEAEAMDNCVMVYCEDVRAGKMYFYSVRKSGDRIATFTLKKKPDGYQLAEIAGPRNRRVSGEISEMVHRWLDDSA